MSKRIVFKDGTYIAIVGDRSNLVRMTYTYPSSLLAYRKNNIIVTKWTGSKEDLDGNIWTFASNGALTIRKGTNTWLNLTFPNNKIDAIMSLIAFRGLGTNLIALAMARQTNVGSAGNNSIFSLDDEPAFLEHISSWPAEISFYASSSNNACALYTGDRSTFGGGLNIDSWRVANSTQDMPTDPYTPGGESDLAGGEGDFDNTSVPIDFPNLPTLSAVDTGLISLFNPSVAEIKALATYMWGPPFDMENWKKLFANPMDAILGLSIVPVHVPDGGQSTVKVGNIDTNISMNKAGSQYTEVDCGSLSINEYWGAYLDYEPYTHVQLYLPYIGVKEISTDDVMSKPVHIKYHVDILSGSCVAYVKCGESVLYSFTGQCAASIPITGRDYTGVVNSAINIVSSAMGMFAMGQSASALGQAAGLAKSAGSQARLSANAARSALSAGSGAANIATEAINITKPVIQKSGNISSAAGLLGIQTPYMILTRPRQCLPTDQNHYLGYPSLITTSLSSCSGFTRVEAIHLENIGATDEEIAEIESILHSGVIF